MLIKKSQELIELSQKKVKLHRDATNREGFKTRQKQVSESHQKIKELVESLRLFRNQGLISTDFKPTIKQLLVTVETTYIKYQEQPESILDNNNFNGTEFKDEINKIISRVEKELLQAWKNYLKNKKPSTQTDLLKILERVESFRPNIDRIRQLETQIKSEQFPKYLQQFEQINNLIQDLNNTWNSLGADNVPEEVLTFLKAAASNTGSSLELFSPRVYTWVREHHLDKKLRIRFN